MIKGIGVDIVKLDRIKKIGLERFKDRILSDEEVKEYFKINHESRKLTYLGGRFAAKEALFKCFKDELKDATFKDFSFLNNNDGSPYLLSKYTKEYTTHITISHTNSDAVAFVVLEFK
ncbi:MAG: holo-ACP synthase [Acholeplasmataceae bacterium]